LGPCEHRQKLLQHIGADLIHEPCEAGYLLGSDATDIFERDAAAAPKKDRAERARRNRGQRQHHPPAAKALEQHPAGR